MSETTREVRLASRPEGKPAPENFEIAEVPLPEPAEGQALVRNSYLSVDPYMRGRMRDVKSYSAPFEVGKVMEGGAVGQVVASRNADLPEGTWIQTMNGWREHFVVEGKGGLVVDPAVAPISTSLGVLGMTGLTAYAGLTLFGRPQEGETVFVSAAAGAVGSVVGQLAKLRGCRAVGSAGGPEKVSYVTEDLGFDAAFDYKQTDPLSGLREAAPDGIDIYFENVGGDHFDAALACMNVYGRIAVCGAISNYNSEDPVPGPDNLLTTLIAKRIDVRGFLVLDHYDLFPQFLEEVGGYVRDGKLVYRETIVDGIENMPGAFIDLLEGANTGKMLVRVGPDPD
jgi:NADPH-dependent curcumin reductase CurA